MKYVKKGKDIIVSDIGDFNLAQTLECGQFLHFMRSDGGIGTDVSEYALAAFGKGLRVRQEGDTFTFFDTDKYEFEKVWIPYFDLDRDYGMIKDFIIERNPELREIVEKNAGIRLLNQDFFETLLSFIMVCSFLKLAAYALTPPQAWGRAYRTPPRPLRSQTSLPPVRRARAGTAC